jgi:hypothetical protein
MGLHQIKKFLHIKETITKVERHPHNGRKFAQLFNRQRFNIQNMQKAQKTKQQKNK